MISPGVVVDSWRVSEFTSDDDQSVIQHAAFCEILNQHSDRAVMARQLVVQRSGDIGMIVEVARVQRNIAYSGLNQAASQQGLFAPARTVSFSQRNVFFRHIKRATNPAGENQIHGLMIDGIHLFEQSIAIDLSLKTIELAAQGNSIHHAIARQAVGE